jgi:UDP-glucose 4-epimerase
MANSKLILVTGASGAVGPRIVEALCASNFRVRTLSIDPLTAGTWPDNVETNIGDVTDGLAVHAAMQGVDSVIHLAALLNIANPPPALREKFERINVGGTSLVVRAAIQAGARRVVFFSTSAVYGQSKGRILTEDAPPAPDSFYSRTKLEAEKIVLDANDAHGRPMGSVLRLGAVYGSRIKGNYSQLLKALAKGRFVPIGNNKNRRTLIYDKDVARAAILAVEHPKAAGKIYNVSDGAFHTMGDIISTMCQALGRKPPFLSLPAAPVRFAAGLIEDLSRMVRLKAPITRFAVEKYIEDFAVTSERFRNELGFVPQYDLLSGWRETVIEMKDSGIL